MADWSMLPNDILEQIALKLDYPEDIVYFSTVCHSWHCVYSMVCKKWTARTPLLMLPENTKDNLNYLRKLYCPSKQKCYQLKLSETFGARCWGSSCGWIVTLDPNLELHLFNPLTKVRIGLPPQSTMPNQDEDVEDIQWFMKIDKVYVLTDDNDGFLIMALYGCFENYIAYARPGDQRWTSIITPREVDRYVHDIVRWGSQILILYNNLALGCCDMSAIQNSQPATVMKYSLSPSGVCRSLHNRAYLLELFGDLLMILRLKDDILDENDLMESDLPFLSVEIEVYKLNFDTKKWKEVKELGEVALFVGNNSSMFARASRTDNCRQNRIYFTEDDSNYWEDPKFYDMGVFDMEGGKFAQVYEGERTYSTFCPALWFMPKF